MSDSPSNIVGDEPCPACRSAGRDSTGNHLMIFENGSKWCDRCLYTVSENGSVIGTNKYDYTPEYGAVAAQGKETSGVIDDTPSVPSSTLETIGINNLTSEKFRGIPASLRSKYGVLTEMDTNGDHISQLYPMYSEGSLHTHKVRKLPKDFYSLKTTKGLKIDLFGQNVAGGKKDILITEGEEDAMAAQHMLDSCNVACVSLPSGANSKAISDNKDFLKKYKRVIFCPDGDDAGKKAMKAIAKVFPKVYIMTTSEKDACEMLARGKKTEFVNDFYRAELYKPSSIVSVNDIKVEALKPVEWGLSYPWEALTVATYGLRTPQLIGVGAGPGAGKTTLIQGIQNHIVDEHDERIAVFSLEETPEFSLKKLAGAKLNLPIHLPDCTYDSDEVEAIMDSYDDKVYFYDHSGYKDFDDIEEAIMALAVDNVKYFFIDPLSALAMALPSSEANDFLNGAMIKMASLVQNYNITIFHVNHLNNPQGAKDHGEGAKVRAGQFSGSRSMWKFSTDMWGLARDQYAEDEDERNKVEIQILKSRLSGKTTAFPLKYNSTTGCLEELHKGSGF